MSREVRLLLLGLLVLAMLGSLYWLGRTQPPRDQRLQPVAGCDLQHGPCRAGDPNSGEVVLQITPQPIPVLEELALAVQLHGVKARAVEVQFTGVDVDMGLLRYPLRPSGEGHYSGPAWLSVCSQRRMTWQAMVLVKTDEGEVSAPFRFDTEYRRGFTVLE